MNYYSCGQFTDSISCHKSTDLVYGHCFAAIKSLVWQYTCVLIKGVPTCSHFELLLPPQYTSQWIHTFKFQWPHPLNTATMVHQTSLMQPVLSLCDYFCMKFIKCCSKPHSKKEKNLYFLLFPTDEKILASLFASLQPPFCMQNGGCRWLEVYIGLVTVTCM